ncbi:MAG: inositol monophosphatase, partial [bacterium]
MRQTHSQSVETMSEIVAEQGGDVIFAIDKTTEKLLLDFCEKELYPEFEFVLIAEGLPEDAKKLFSKKCHAGEVPYRIIVDPIDGTRLLMYDKRSAWILTGVAENRGEATSLRDIFFAMQTEIPTRKQTLADTLWAYCDRPAEAIRENLATGETTSFTPAPSRAKTLDQGFASFVHFFHGSKEVLSRIDEALCQKLYGEIKSGQAWTFEDQYMSTGGQIYELATGRDRLIVDLRAFAGKLLQNETGLCCHPYDICTELI